MADPLLYEGEHYVVLTPTAPEELCTEAELRERLQRVLDQMPELTPELAVYPTVAERVQYLLDRACRLEWGEGEFMEWYLVRLEKRR
ncbi:MAG: chlororespiratory reduction protein 7 [Gloeomargarita sp. SKYG116]|nr:chlororespiratory reduction protein 7 [Gloeomargarita sp. SKYG116]MDW8400217.1 chlororespiratory reduction protein 7 [Gloeomargarita sp. SKYGB_i_bin116]